MSQCLILAPTTSLNTPQPRLLHLGCFLSAAFFKVAILLALAFHEVAVPCHQNPPLVGPQLSARAAPRGIPVEPVRPLPDPTAAPVHV